MNKFKRSRNLRKTFKIKLINKKNKKVMKMKFHKKMIGRVKKELNCIQMIKNMSLEDQN